jgi:AsmA protein
MEQAAAHAPRASRRVFKYTLAALSALAFALVAVIAYIAATFDPRELHPRAIDLVREKTGRTLEIRGATTLSFWPDVGVRLNALSLSERGSAETFAAIEAARVTLKLVPLLKGEIVATDLSIAGASVRVTRDAEGRLNIADLLEGEGGPSRFDIGRVAIERSTLTYRDLASGAQYEFGAIALETGRLAAGAMTPLILSAVLRDSADTFHAQIRLETRLALDFDQQRYTLGAARLELSGEWPGLSGVTAQAGGDAVLDGRTKRVGVSALEAAMNGMHGQDAIAVTLGAASLAFVPMRLDGEGVRVTLIAKGPAGTTEAKLELPAVKRDGDRIESAAAALDLKIQRGEHRVNATVSTALEAALPTRALHLKEVDATFTAHGPRLPRGGVSGALKGEAQLDATREGVHARLAGKVADSRVKIRLAAAGFASPVYTFAVDVDQLDLDRYVGGNAAGRKPSSAARAQHLLEPLEGLPATGALTIGVLKGTGVKATNVRLALR